MALGIQSQQKELDGIEFEISQLPSTAAKRLFERLVRAVGPSLAQSDDAGKALATLFERLSQKDSEEIEHILLEKALVKVDDKWVPLKGVYELIFAGKITTIYKLLGFALEVNFGDFLKAVAGSGSLAAKFKEVLSSRLASRTNGPTSDSSSEASPVSKS
jgi:hypothetical protein